MTSRKSQNYPKDSFRQETSNKRIEEESANQRVRIIQKKLVFINGLPSNLSEKELLETDLYFGRYGKVIKTIVNPPQPFKKNITYQAYVTYENELDASLAIAALDGFKLSERPLKVSYGTTKYCSHYLRGYDCPNNDCYYLHKIDKRNEIMNGDSRTIFKEQNNDAIDTVCDNLEQVVERSLNNPNQKVIDGFPTLSQMIEFLIESKMITQYEIEGIKKKLKKNRVKTQKQQKIQQVKSDKTRQNQNKQIKTQPKQQDYIPKQVIKTVSLNVQSPKEVKLAKSSSFSTNSSPFKIQNQQFLAISTGQQENTLKIQQKIQKLILKELLRNQKQYKSRFQFVSRQSKGKIEEIDRIKGIFQKYLIVQN